MSGFAHAPICKGVIIISAITTFTAGAFNAKYNLHLPLSPHLTRDHQFWRIFTHHIAFANSSEFFMGVMLTYSIGITIERMFGSLKFASYLLVSAFLVSILELIALAFGSSIGLKYIPAGPFGLLFAIIYAYYISVPPVYQFKIFGVNLSSKSWGYFFAFQLFVSQPPRSVVPCFAGILSGAVIRANILGLRSWRLPPFIVRLGKQCAPLLGSTQTHRRSQRTSMEDEGSTRIGAGMGAAIQQAGQSSNLLRRSQQSAGLPAQGGGGQQQTQPQTGNRAASALSEWREALTGSRAPQVNSDAVQQLQAMFPTATRPQITTALQRANNDVPRAVETLLAQT